MAPPSYLHDCGRTPPLLNTGQDCPLTPLSLNPIDSDSRRLVPDQCEIDEANLQECWDQSIAKHMDLPDGYSDVHVLIIKWHDDIDDLKVRQEVDDLKNLFENTFNYEVYELQLEDEKWATQSILESEINKWAKARDRDDILFVVYYAGHGEYDLEKKILELHPYPTDDPEESSRVIWNYAERPLLEKIRADVLTIMDCCFASDLLRNIHEVGRTFEMLAASHMGQTTGSGENSFTRCLIKNLGELAAELPTSFFTTFDLQERMQKDRPKQVPALWRRLPGSQRHIRLGPLKPRENRPKRNKDLAKHERFLTLGFALKNDLFNDSHIEKLTKKLPQTFKEEGVPLTDIKFLGLRRPQGPRFRDIAEYVRAHRKHLTAISPSSARKRPAEESEESDTIIEKKAKLD